jgi:acid phosphatase (class A)
MSSSSQENARGSTHPGFSLMGSLPAPPYCADEKTMPTSRQIHVAIALLAVLGMSACSKGKLPPDAAAASQAQRYLPGNMMPDSLEILSPPPAQGSEEMARDDALRLAALNLRGTPRYALALADADRGEASTVKAFECALSTGISAQRTPALMRLLAKVRLDVRASAYKAKEHYKRPRPWVANGAPVCRSSETTVQNDGSYPSARGAVGWAYALVLAEVNPSRRDALLHRGRQFGESRVICDAEWQSDVDAGNKLAALAVQRMHQNKLFLADLASSRQEVADEIRSGGRAGMDCSLEDRARAGDRQFAAAISAAGKDGDLRHAARR